MMATARQERDLEKIRRVEEYRKQMDAWLRERGSRDPNIRQAGVLCDLLNEFEVKSLPLIESGVAKNTHYNACCWSNPKTTCGPDTCDCDFASMRWHRIVQNARELNLF